MSDVIISGTEWGRKYGMDKGCHTLYLLVSVKGDKKFKVRQNFSHLLLSSPPLPSSLNYASRSPGLKFMDISILGTPFL